MFKAGGGAYFAIIAEVACSEKLSDVRVTIEQGERGSPSYFQAELLSVPELLGSAKLLRLEVGDTGFPAILRFYATRRDHGKMTHAFSCSVPLSEVLKDRLNQRPQGTPGKEPSSSTEPEARRP